MSSSGQKLSKIGPPRRVDRYRKALRKRWGVGLVLRRSELRSEGGVAAGYPVPWLDEAFNELIGSPRPPEQNWIRSKRGLLPSVNRHQDCSKESANLPDPGVLKWD